MTRNILTACAMLLLFGVASFANSNEERQIAWGDLQKIVGKKVRVVMPDGTQVQGKAVAVEADALTVQVSKTSNAGAYPKGKLLVPRATLKSFDVKHSTYHWRVIGVTIGVVAGVAVFALVSVEVDGIFGKPGAVSWAAAAALPAAGYFLGQKADQQVTTYVVAQ